MLLVIEAVIPPTSAPPPGSGVAAPVSFLRIHVLQIAVGRGLKLQYCIQEPD